MKLYLEIIDQTTKPVENYSPYEVRQLLIKVLTVKDWASDEKYTSLLILVEKYVK